MCAKGLWAIDPCRHVDPVCISIRPSFLFIDVSVIGLSERPITETSINKKDGLIETHTGSSRHGSMERRDLLSHFCASISFKSTPEYCKMPSIILPTVELKPVRGTQVKWSGPLFWGAPSLISGLHPNNLWFSLCCWRRGDGHWRHHI